MKRVAVNVEPNYEVLIGKDLLPQVGNLIADVISPQKVFVVTDSHVAPLYLDRLTKSLQQAGFQVESFVFEAGEASKTISTYEKVLSHVADAGISRSDAIVALGGGVVGDLAGFVAGTYMRGIDYVQIPTTLLSAIDSSVGGKTGVDLEQGKNLVGVFLQPRLVVCDTDLLTTLPDHQIASGYAEVIKTAILFDPELFSLLARKEGASLDEIIARCVAHKGAVVEADEREAGERKLLNLGHTAGHAIERLSNYEVAHGHAVAIGLSIIARAADKLGFAERPIAHQITSLLQQYNLPTSTQYSAHELALAAYSDKKRSGNMITTIMPREIGHCELLPVTMQRLEEIFDAGLEL